MAIAMTIRIMLVDDHRMLREVVREALNAEPDLRVMAEAGSGREALAQLSGECPEVLLLDIALPDMTGIELAIQSLAKYPKLRIVALSGYTDKAFVDEMLKAGARAYVVKSAGMRELVQAIRAVLAGHVFLSPEITGAMPGARIVHASASISPPASVLGRREREVLKLLAMGRRSGAIAAELGIQPAMVDVLRSNIKKKLGLRSLAELTRYALREGLLLF
jgi:DNA-binding NarL/FixJ family response regulator